MAKRLFRWKPLKKLRYLTVISLLIIAIILPIILVHLLNPTDTEAAWYNTTWTYRKQLTIDYTKVSGGSDLSNFPVLINLSETALSAAQSSGNDILFTSSDGTTKLSHEIESFSQASGEIVAWVKIPTLSASTNTNIYMYWGNSGASSQQDATNVWDSNYKGVWHLSQSNGNSRTDSTSNANTLSENGTGGVGSSISKVGPYATFTRSNTQYLSRTNASQTGLGITGAITVEAWINSNDISDTTNNVILAKDGASGNAGYSLRGATSKVTFKISNDGTANTTAGGATTLASNTWYHFAGVYDGSTIKVYLNGAQDGSTAYSSGIFASTGDFNIGGRNGGSNLWDGNIDEVRISNTNRTAGWIATEYNNQSSPSTFFTQFKVQQKNAPVLSWKFDEGQGTTANDSGVNSNNGTITNATWQTEDMCVSGKCLSFDGSGDYVSKTYSADTDLNVGTSGFSIGAWFKHPTSISGTDTIVSRADGVNGVGYKLYYSATTGVCFGIDQTAGSFPVDSACTTTSYADNNWHYIEGVKTGTTSLTLYIDGKQVAQDTSITASSISGTSAGFYVGIDVDGSSNPWVGSIDEVTFYDTARSSSQILADYDAKGGAAGSSNTLGYTQSASSLGNGLLGYWKMNETAANSCTGGTNDACDSSGNGADGAISGTASIATGKFANALDFNGTTGYLDMGNTAEDFTTNAKLTLSAWVYRDTESSDEPIISNKFSNAASDAGYTLYAYSSANGNNVCVYLADGTNQADACTANNTRVLPLSTWTLVSATCDAKSAINCDIYINGVLSTSTHTNVSLGSISSATAPFRIAKISGANTGTGDFFDGRIDDVRIYSRVLTKNEESALYNWGPGPIGQWKLDEGSGTTANDSSGNGLTGTLNNGPLWDKGKNGTGVHFDGGTSINSDTIDLGDQSSLELNNISIEAWVYRMGTCNFSVCTIMAKGQSANTGYSLEVADSGSGYKARISLNDSLQNVTGSTTINTNTWYHITGSFDGTTVRVYVNGILDGSASQTQTPSFASETAAIGNRNSNRDLTFNGIIDEVQVYNYVRTQKQVISDMNSGHPAVGSPVGSATAWWSFDEGGAATTINDKSLNSNSLSSLGLFSNSIFTESGILGKAWLGNGSNWLTRADDDDFDFAAGDDFSISTWFKTTSATNPAADEYIINKRSASAGYAIWITTTGEIRGGIDDDATSFPEDLTETNNDIYDGAWHHIVLTKTSTALNLYLDGKLKDSDQALSATGSLANTQNIYLGDRDGVNNGDEFNGAIDETKIYRYALSDDEVKVDYNLGKATAFGNSSTTSTGTIVDNSSARSYCVPGDTSTCNAPVLELKLDERSGTTADDTSGNGNEAAITNATWTKGRVGGALSFDGSGDYGVVSSPNSLPTGDYTYEGWFYVNSLATTNYLLNINDEFALFTGTDGTITHSASATDLGSWMDITTGKWYFVAATRASGAMKTYINGVMDINTTTDAGTLSLSTCPLILGSDYSSSCATPNINQLNGKMDNIRAYNYARTAAQVAWDYNHGGPVARYNFDECTGTTIHNVMFDPNSNPTQSFPTSFDGTWSGSSGGNTAVGTCNDGNSAHAWNNGTTGKRNSALDFDGTDDAVTISSTATANTIFSFIDRLTMSAWIKSDATGTSTNREIISRQVAGQNAYDFGIVSGKLRLYLDGTTVTGATTLNSGGATWYHVAATWDKNVSSGAITLYVNGVVDGTGTKSASVNDYWQDVVIGSTSGGSQSYFNGLIDDVQFFGYALNPTQIKMLYNENSALRFGPSSGPP